MKYLIVTDSTADGPTRSYLCRPSKPRSHGWHWTFQREEAAEFASLKDAQRIIETIMRLKAGIRIVPVSGDPQPANDSTFSAD